MASTRLVLCLVPSAAVVWSGACPARADSYGNWWYEALGVPQARNKEPPGKAGR